MRVLGTGLAVLVSSVVAQPSAADERGVVGLVVENDIFGNTDRNYTSGLKLTYVSPWGEEDELTRWIVDNLWLGDRSLRLRTVYGLGHNMFTPEDLSVVGPQPDDRPYAGYLYGSYGIVAEDKTTVSTLDLEFGVVGPSAQGEWVQENFHSVFKFDEPRGWDNQLNDEPAFALTIERQWKDVQPAALDGLEYEIRPHAGVSLGNVRSDVFAGATVRFGTQLRSGSLPPRVRPSLAGSGFFDPTSGMSWYGFLGLNGRFVAQNLFLDGNTWGESLSVDKKPFVADIQTGVAVQWGGVQISYTYVVRTEEFEGQVGNDRFGAIGIAAQL